MKETAHCKIDHNQIASDLNPVLRFIDNSNIDPGAARLMNRFISGQRQSSVDVHWCTGVF